MSSVLGDARSVKVRRKPQFSWAYGFMLLPLLGFIAFFWFVTHHVTKPDMSMFEAVETGNFEAVQDHLATGTPVDALSGTGHTALYVAIQHQQEKIAELLLDSGAPVNAENRAVPSPLYLAAGKGNAELVRRLVDLGANVNSTSKSGLTPLHAAADSGNPEVVKLLLERGANPGGTAGLTKGPPLCNAAEKGNVESVRLLIERGADINSKGFLGRSPLHLAAARSHYEIVRYLLAQGANVDQTDRQGTIPLASALAHDEDPRLFWLLYKHTTRFDASDFQEGNLLHYAVSSGASIDILNALISKGLDVNRPDYLGQTPLALAVAANNDDAARALERAGARLPLRTLIRIAVAGPKQPKRFGFDIK